MISAPTKIEYKPWIVIFAADKLYEKLKMGVNLEQDWSY
jgi:hypothetical protein